jgi:hypothetical protein
MKKTFYSSLNSQIDKMLKQKYQFVVSDANVNNLLKDISNDIKEIVECRLKEENSDISEEATTWLKNVLFQKVSLADGLSISDLIVMNNYSLDELSYNDLTILSNLLKGSEFEFSLKKELKNKNDTN